jgi:hypothetical protein
MYHRLGSNLQSSYLSLLSAGIIDTTMPSQKLAFFKEKEVCKIYIQFPQKYKLKLSCHYCGARK